MDRLQRSNSSISSRTGCPPDIVNEEDHNVNDSEVPDHLSDMHFGQNLQ